MEKYGAALTDVGVPLSAAPLGLMRIEYDVPANTAIGSYATTFYSTPDFSDGDFVNPGSIYSGDYSAVGTIGGAINVVPTPEPASIVFMVLGAFGLLGFARLRTRRTL